MVAQFDKPKIFYSKFLIVRLIFFRNGCLMKSIVGKGGWSFTKKSYNSFDILLRMNCHESSLSQILKTFHSLWPKKVLQFCLPRKERDPLNGRYILFWMKMSNKIVVSQFVAEKPSPIQLKNNTPVHPQNTPEQLEPHEITIVETSMKSRLWNLLIHLQRITAVHTRSTDSALESVNREPKCSSTLRHVNYDLSVFIPSVVSVDVGMAMQMTNFMQRLAPGLSLKWQRTYSNVFSVLRRKLVFSTIWSVQRICFWGAFRSTWRITVRRRMHQSVENRDSVLVWKVWREHKRKYKRSTIRSRVTECEKPGLARWQKLPRSSWWNPTNWPNPHIKEDKSMK